MSRFTSSGLATLQGAQIALRPRARISATTCSAVRDREA